AREHEADLRRGAQYIQDRQVHGPGGAEHVIDAFPAKTIDQRLCRRSHIETLVPACAALTMASSTATLGTSSPPRTASVGRSPTAGAKYSSSAFSVLNDGKRMSSGACFMVRFARSMKQVRSVHVERCSTSPTSAQPFEPNTCMRQVSAVAITVPR